MRQTPPCNHIASERSLVGTWATLELLKAVNIGYQILEMYEVYHFENKSTSLFSSYIDSFLKIKQESSGWPSECTSDDAKQYHLKNYKEKEGVILNPRSIEVNPGRRSVAKLCLNSFWGTFGQSDEKQMTTFVSSVSEFNGIFTDPTKQVKDVGFPTDEVAYLQWGHKQHFFPQNIQTNIFIAAFTTSHARLKLYSEFEKLQEHVLYYDTDSIIYISTGENDPLLGNYLGEFTDELCGDYITEFVAAGPKNYAFRTSKGVNCCKIRGFTLHYENSKLLDMDTLKLLVMEKPMETVRTTNQ